MPRRTKEQKEEDLAKLKNAIDDSNNEIDPDLLSDPMFQAAVKERDYSSGKMDIIGDAPFSTPEPDNISPVLDLTDIPLDSTLDEKVQSSEDSKTKISDDSEDNYSKSDQKEFAINASDTIVDIYKLAIDLALEGMTKTREKYQLKAIEGKFDMRVLQQKIDFGDGTNCTWEEFCHSYNEELKQIMVLDPEKEKELREILKRVSMSRGIVMSDEMRLIFVFGEDVINKLFRLIALNKTVKNIEKVMLRQVLIDDENLKMAKREQARKHNITEDKNQDEPITAQIIREKGE